MKKTVILFALIISGCSDNNGRMGSSPGVDEFHVGYKLTITVPLELEHSFEAGSTYWREKTGTELFISVENYGDIAAEVRQLPYPMLGLSLVGAKRFPPNSTFYVTDGRLYISSAIISDDECADSTMTHELGHFLGLNDDSHTGKIMDGDSFWCESADLLDSDRELIMSDLRNKAITVRTP